MPTTCSAICKAMRVGDNTVGTYTNCSADCGSAKCLQRLQPSAAQEDRESARTGRRSRDLP